MKEAFKKDILRDESGQLLPFLAIVLLIMLSFGVYGLSSAIMHRDRMNVRDALDAAATAALSAASSENVNTWLYEVPTEYDENGDPIAWGKRASGPKARIVFNDSKGKELARGYFEKNMGMDGLQYRVVNWDVSAKLEPRKLQISKKRPHTEGVVTSWEEGFPRWVEVTVIARVEIPIPLGKMLGREKTITRLSSRAVKELR